MIAFNQNKLDKQTEILIRDKFLLLFNFLIISLYFLKLYHIILLIFYLFLVSSSAILIYLISSFYMIFKQFFYLIINCKIYK